VLILSCNGPDTTSIMSRLSFVTSLDIHSAPSVLIDLTHSIIDPAHSVYYFISIYQSKLSLFSNPIICNLMPYFNKRGEFGQLSDPCPNKIPDQIFRFSPTTKNSMITDQVPH
jgi:hypothetical protein